MGTAYGYLRKSSVRRGAIDLAPETQEREVRQLAERFGDAERLIVRADWDVSGAERYTARRTGYRAVVQAIEDGRCTALYSYSLSRLGRSVQELSRLFTLCASKGVPLRLVADAIDTSTATGRLQATMLAGVAQFESEIASERLIARNTTKRLRGESLRTRKLYGETEGEDAPAVLAAFRETGSYSRAARLLNERGLLARSGKPWWSSSVRVVVQRLDASITSSGRGARTIGQFTLARLLICPTCHRLLTGSRLALPHGDYRTRYACRYAESSPHPRVAITETKVLPWVREQLEGYQLPGGAVVDLSAERTALIERRDRWLDNFASGYIDRAERDRQLGPIVAALSEIDARERAVTPDEIDWNADPRVINSQLRTLLNGVVLDADFLPIKLRWQFGTFVRWTTGNLPDLADMIATEFPGARPLVLSDADQRRGNKND